MKKYALVALVAAMVAGCNSFDTTTVDVTTNVRVKKLESRVKALESKTCKCKCDCSGCECNIKLTLSPKCCCNCTDVCTCVKCECRCNKECCPCSNPESCEKTIRCTGCSSDGVWKSFNCKCGCLTANGDCSCGCKCGSKEGKCCTKSGCTKSEKKK